MKIIPAIDIIEGKCMRLNQGGYAQQKIYNEDPLEVAKDFAVHGVKYLHLVDLDGACSQQVVNYRVLERIAARTSVRIGFGGGIKRDEDVRIILESGAAQVSGGSIADKDPALFESWIQRFGPEVIILGAHCRDRKIAVQGWA